MVRRLVNRKSMGNIFKVLGLVGFLFLHVVALSAATLADSFGGRSATVTVSFNDSTNVLTWSASHTGSSGSYAASAQLYKVASHGSTTPLENLYVNSAPQGNSGSGTYPAYSGDYFLLQTYIAGPSGTNSLERLWFLCGPSAHVVTVSPSSASVRVGQTANFTASGGQNGYNWSATNGGSLAYDGANAGFTASAAATYIVQVWSPAGGGYLESNYATATITVTASEKVKIPLPANTTGRPIEYLFIANGITIGSAVQNIGAPARVVEETLPPEIPSGTPVKVFAKTLGIQQDEDNGVWTLVPDAVAEVEVMTVTPSENPPEPGDSDFIGPIFPNSPDPVTGDQSGKGVWTSAPTTAGLSDGAYKEGVDKTTVALEKINKTLNDKLSNVEGGGGGDVSGVISAVNETTAALQSSTVIEDLPELDGTADAQKADGLVDSAINLIPDAPTIVAPASESVLNIPFVAGGQSYSGSIDFAQWSGPIAIFRGLCSACMLIFFVIVFIRTIRGGFATT